jgi:hypothetical protein
MPQSPESLRLMLAGLAFVAFLSGVVLEALGTPSERVWAAFSGLIAALVGQHLDKPEQPFTRASSPAPLNPAVGGAGA